MCRSSPPRLGWRWRRWRLPQAVAGRPTCCSAGVATTGPAGRADEPPAPPPPASSPPSSLFYFYLPLPVTPACVLSLLPIIFSLFPSLCCMCAHNTAGISRFVPFLVRVHDFTCRASCPRPSISCCFSVSLSGLGKWSRGRPLVVIQATHDGSRRCGSAAARLPPSGRWQTTHPRQANNEVCAD